MTVLADILSSRTRAAVFGCLFGLVPREMHVRAIQRESGLAFATVRQELDKLEEHDLVVARRDGNRLYYRANATHPLYPDIRSLILKTTGLRDVLAEALGTEGIDAAFVFGSLASDSATAESDLDLMVIGTVGLREVTRRLRGAAEKIGRELNPHVMTPEEFVSRVKQGDHFVSAVQSGPRLYVTGSDDELAGVG